VPLIWSLILKETWRISYTVQRLRLTDGDIALPANQRGFPLDSVIFGDEFDLNGVRRLAPVGFVSPESRHPLLPVPAFQYKGARPVGPLSKSRMFGEQMVLKGISASIARGSSSAGSFAARLMAGLLG